MKKKLKLFSLVMVAIASCLLLSACGSNISLKINFDSNGGTYCKPIEYVVGKSFNMPDDPTKENYIFGGWYEDNDTWEKPFTVNTVLNYPLSKDVEITVYAKWIPVMYINFDTNGGNSLDRLVYNSADITIPSPERNGYTFLGWYYDNGAWQQEFTIDSLENITPKSEITVYAKWALNRYINFETNGGTECEPINFTTSTNYDLPTPTKPTYIFKGWYMDSSFNIPYDKSLISFDDYETAIVLYAKWEEKKVQNITFNGTPKLEYFYGEEVDTNGMYADVEYYYYASERVYITKNMIYGFDSTRLVKDSSVSEIKDTMYVSISGKTSENFVYTIKPKYKSIQIKENSYQSSYVVGENSEYIEKKCSESNYINGKYYKALKFTVIATNYDDTNEEINVIAYGDEKNNFKTICDFHDKYYHYHYVIINNYFYLDLDYIIFPWTGEICYPCDQNDNNIDSALIYDSERYCIDCDNKNNGIYSNAYCDISTNTAGTFTGILYLGLCSATFEYTVNYANSKVKTFEIDSGAYYSYIKEIADNPTLLNETVTIELENGRKFDWKIDKQDYIMSDFDLSTTGEKEAIVQFPFVSESSYYLLKIPYIVKSLEEIEYLSIENFTLLQCDETLKLSNIKLDFFAYYYDNKELKSIWFTARLNNFTNKEIRIDLSKIGKQSITVKMCDIDVKIKYNILAIDKIVMSDEIHIGDNISLEDATLIAGYEDTDTLVNINTKQIASSYSSTYWSDFEAYYSFACQNSNFFDYEIIEDIDTSSAGEKQAKIKLCGKEFGINYTIVE